MLYEKETAASPLFLPFVLLSLTVIGMLGLQVYLLNADRKVFSEAQAKQTELLGNLEKAKNQSSDLVKNVVNLAKQDNRNAENILNELKKAGVNFQDGPVTPGAQAPAAVAPVAPASPAPVAAPAPAPAAAPAKK